MAALTWLHTLGRRTKTSQEFLTKLRARCDASGTDLRGWWDWLYLHKTLSDRARSREASRVLVKTGDVQSHWVYLTCLEPPQKIEYSVMGSPSQPKARPALSQAEIEQVLASVRVVLQRRPDWVDGELLTGVLAALKDAGRNAEADSVFQDSVLAAVRSMQIVSLMTLAGERGDLNGLLTLFAKLEGRSWPLMGTNVYPSSKISEAFMIVMDARAKAGALADVLRLVDGFLDVNRRRSQAARALGGEPPPSSILGTRAFHVVDYQRTLPMDFPSTSDFLDADALLTLGNAFMLHDRVDRLDDLFAHMRDRIAKAGPADIAYDHVVLCGFHWWSDDREEALADLKRARTASPTNPALPLELARMHEHLGRPDEALAVIDAIPTPDQASFRRREWSALRVATGSGRSDRAKLATERLFGTRLRAEFDVLLALSMRQIGLKAESGALLDRIRAQSGGRPPSLYSVMTEYQAPNPPEAAVEVASQIIRISPRLCSRRRRPVWHGSRSSAGGAHLSGKVRQAHAADHPRGGSAQSQSSIVQPAPDPSRLLPRGPRPSQGARRARPNAEPPPDRPRDAISACRGTARSGWGRGRPRAHARRPADPARTREEEWHRIPADILPDVRQDA